MTTPIDLDDLVARVAALENAAGGRRLVGIAGPPGAGKSTIAHRVAARFDPPLPVVSMDGFHLPNSTLDELGRRDRKGAPDTFDANAFVELLIELRTEPPRTVAAPSFDRTIDEPTPGGVMVDATDALVVVEGNYLLLAEPPWDRVRELLDLVAYVDLEPGERRRRLVARHVAFGKPVDAARRFVERSDEANAHLVAGSRSRADVVVPGPT